MALITRRHMGRPCVHSPVWHKEAVDNSDNWL